MNASARPALGAAAALLLAACTSSPKVAALRRQWTERSNNGMSDWSNKSIDMMIDKYGAPDRVETLGLVWYRRGPWVKIVVWDELGFLYADRASRNLEETIAYPVPLDKRAALASFGGGLRIDGLRISENGAELSARSQSEDRNFLMLNLADEIVRGLLSPEDARVAYRRALQLADAGKSSPMMQGLVFR